jgi:hypothetical protein
MGEGGPDLSCPSNRSLAPCIFASRCLVGEGRSSVHGDLPRYYRIFNGMSSIRAVCKVGPNISS